MPRRAREWPTEIADQLPGPTDHSDHFLEPDTGATWYVNAYHAEPWTRLDLRRLLHVPPSHDLIRLDLTEPGQYPDYAFQIFGLAAPGPGALRRWARPLGRPPFELYLREMLATVRGCPVVARCSWWNGTWSTHLDAVTARRSPDDLTRAATALDVLIGMTRHGGPTAMSAEDALEDAIRLGLEWLEDHPDKRPEDFSRNEFAAARCTSRDAADKWMTEKHFGIRQVQRELARRKRRPS